MPSYSPEDLRQLLRCPDDSGELSLLGSLARCASCGREYALRAPNSLELMPSKPWQRPESSDLLVRASRDFYDRHFHERWEDKEGDLPWGHPDNLPPRLRRHYDFMARLVGASAPAKGGSFLDISAGNGTLSLPLASRFERTVLADFMVASAAWLGRQGKTLVLRTDYMQSPYAPEAFDFVLCTDTLIYGRDHEERLLQALWAALKPGGKALLSFHHRRHHNPLTAPIVVGYSRGEMLGLLNALSPLPSLKIIPYYQEFEGNLEGGSLWERALGKIFPDTRFFVEAQKP